MWVSVRVREHRGAEVQLTKQGETFFGLESGVRAKLHAAVGRKQILYMEQRPLPFVLQLICLSLFGVLLIAQPAPVSTVGNIHSRFTKRSRM